MKEGGFLDEGGFSSIFCPSGGKPRSQIPGRLTIGENLLSLSVIWDPTLIFDLQRLAFYDDITFGRAMEELAEASDSGGVEETGTSSGATELTGGLRIS